MHDVLKSWAVPKNLSLKEGETRTAFMGDIMATHFLAKGVAGVVLDGGVSDAAALAPYRIRPASEGRSFIQNSTRRNTPAAAPATTCVALRQPLCVTMRARMGRKINCPVALAAV